MMSSRGMGAINPKKMPGKKEITRTDDPNKVAMYKKGGKVKKYSGEDGSEVKEEPLNFNLQSAKDDGLNVKPTHAVIDKNYKRVGANISGDIPLDDQSKLNVSADLAAVRARGQGTKAALDRIKAEYTRNLDKDTTFGASMSKSPLDKRFMVALNKTFKNGGSAKQAATAIAMKAAGKKPKKMAAGGELKEVSEDNVGLSKLPTEVRNKMGYMKKGGKTKSKVNEAGNYTKPDLRKRIFNSVKAAAIVGTGAGQWSARKAQVMAKRYKAAGGGYRD